MFALPKAGSIIEPEMNIALARGSSWIAPRRKYQVSLQYDFKRYLFKSPKLVMMQLLASN